MQIKNDNKVSIMKAQRIFLKVIVVTTVLVGGLLWTLVHKDIVGINTEIAPIGVRFFVYPVAAISYFLGTLLSIMSFLNQSYKKDLPLIAININIVSIVFFMIAWLLVLRLYILPLGV